MSPISIVMIKAVSVANIVLNVMYSYPDINFYLTGQSYAKAKELENRKIFLTKDDCIKAVKEIKNGVVIGHQLKIYHQYFQNCRVLLVIYNL